MYLQALGCEAVLAAEAVRDGVRFVREVQDDVNTGTLTKADASPVTVLDFALQAFLISRLAQHFPGDPIVAEEDAARLRAPDARSVLLRVVELVRRMPAASLADREGDTEQVLAWIDRGRGACDHRFWTLDPIDGTKGLLRGGQYVIALALVTDGLVDVAALGCPRLAVTTGDESDAMSGHPPRAAMVALEDHAEGGVALAARGRGAWWMSLRGDRLLRLSVSTETDPTRVRVLQSYEPGHCDVTQVHRTLDSVGVHAPPIPMDSQAKHVLLAAAAAELLLRFPADQTYHEAIWDQAAGSLLIEEAGGRVTDTQGRPLDFATGRRLLRNSGLVASNRVLHEAVLDVIRQRSVRQVDST